VWAIALRRHGCWRDDLNVKLIQPFARNIVASWAKVFEQDIFASFVKASITAADQILREFEDSVPVGLKDRAKVQMDACRQEAKLALDKTLQVVRLSQRKQQRQISRTLTPHIKTQLADGYDQTADIKGRGSVARQKAWHI
jgi:hypothetical protein